MSVGFLVVYTGEETVRCWLQKKVQERQLHIRNGPGEIEAGMKAVDIGRKVFDLFSTSGGGTNDVVDAYFPFVNKRCHLLTCTDAIIGNSTCLYVLTRM